MTTEVAELEQSKGIIGIALSFEICCDEDQLYAGRLTQALKDRHDLIVEHFRPMKDKAFQAHKEICKSEKSYLDPVVEALNAIKRKFGAYALMKQREREAARALAESTARLAAEMAREQELEQAEAQGATAQEIHAMAAAPLPIMMPIAEPAMKVPGMSTAVTWKAAVVSLADLVAAIASGEADLEFVTVNLPALNDVARRTQGTRPIPGVRFYSEPLVRTSRR